MNSRRQHGWRTIPLNALRARGVEVVTLTLALPLGCGNSSELTGRTSDVDTTSTLPPAPRASTAAPTASAPSPAPDQHILAYCEASGTAPIAAPTVHLTPRSADTLTVNLGSQDPAAVWTGDEVLLWGGDHISNGQCPGALSNPRDVGARYHRATQTWSNMNTAGAPTPRHVGAAIWTGTEMVVWGGFGSPGETLTDGARYNPTSDSWSALSTDGAPTNGCPQTVATTQQDLLLWFGGEGYSYALSTDLWQPLPSLPDEFSLDTSSTWSGRELFVIESSELGAQSCTLLAAALDPMSGEWRPIANPPGCFSSARTYWSGQHILLWGNEGAALYSACDDEWKPLPNARPPVDAATAEFTWLGQQLLAQFAERVPGSDFLPSVYYRYVPPDDAWFEMEPLEFGTGVWTGSEYIGIVH